MKILQTQTKFALTLCVELGMSLACLFFACSLYTVAYKEVDQGQEGPLGGPEDTGSGLVSVCTHISRQPLL